MAARLNNDFQFLDVGRQDPSKRDMRTRKHKFVEIYDPFVKEDVEAQSHRCLECGNPYCEWKCPVHNYIPGWLKLVSMNPSPNSSTRVVPPSLRMNIHLAALKSSPPSPLLFVVPLTIIVACAAVAPLKEIRPPDLCVGIVPLAMRVAWSALAFKKYTRAPYAFGASLAVMVAFPAVV